MPRTPRTPLLSLEDRRWLLEWIYDLDAARPLSRHEIYLAAKHNGRHRGRSFAQFRPLLNTLILRGLLTVAKRTKGNGAGLGLTDAARAAIKARRRADFDAVTVAQPGSMIRTINPLVKLPPRPAETAASAPIKDGRG